MGCGHDRNRDHVHYKYLGRHAHHDNCLCDHHGGDGTRILRASCVLLQQLCQLRSVMEPHPVSKLSQEQISDGSALSCLFLYQLQLLGLQQLLGNALGTRLRTQAQIPQLFAKRCRVLVEKASQLDLERLDVGLEERCCLAVAR